MAMKSMAALPGCLLALTACGPSSLPDPRILGIEPDSMLESEPTSVIVAVDAVLPFHASYSEGQATLAPELTVTIGGIAVGPARYQSDGRLPVPVPTLFGPGSYDVSVRLADGRQATAPGAFTVRPGLWPDGYTIDFIGDQRRNTPFVVTLRAVGANAALFRGNVSLEVSRGQVSPGVSGVFTAGVRSEEISVGGGSLKDPITLTVTDVRGTAGVSSPFNVN